MTVTTKKTAGGQQQKNNAPISGGPNVQTIDPLGLNARLYRQVSRLLDDLESDNFEEITIRERIAALIAIGRIQTVFVALRKENKDGDPRTAGSAVRKYARAFKTDGARGGAKDTRRPRRAAAEQLPEPDFIDDDGDDAA